MAFTDYPTAGTVFPQDGASSGISDSDASWSNAAFLGLLAQAESSDYVSKGFDISPDYANNEVTVGSGVLYLEDSADISFRKFDDNEQTRSGLLDQGYLAVIFQSVDKTVSFENTSGVNYIYAGFTRSSQDSNFIRVADTEQTGDRLVEIARVDASSSDASEVNRVAGYGWNYLGKKGTGGNYVSEADISIPDNSFDEYKVKFVAVDGDATSTGITLTGTVNNHNAGYWFRTTQNNTQGNSLYKLMQGRPDHIPINGHMYYSQKGGKWTFDNRITTNQEKQYAFAGGNVDGSATTPINSLQYSWNSGKIKGEWNIWARDVL